MKINKANGIAVFLIAIIVSMMAFVTVGSAVPTFDKSVYTVNPNESYDIDVTLPYTALNTTDHQTGDGMLLTYGEGTTYTPLTDDDVSNITDFDFDTFIPLTDNGTILGSGYYYFNMSNGINNFDGVWIKKSSGLGAYMGIENRTNGAESYAWLIIDDIGTYQEFSVYSNLSYQRIYGVEVEDTGDLLTIPEYVAEYGSIDMFDIYFYPEGGIELNEKNPINFLPPPPDVDHECLLYELHLFNFIPNIQSVVVTDSEQYPQAWGVKWSRVSGGDFTVSIDVPANVDLGSYFLTVTDTNDDMGYTTLSVVEKSNSIWVWIYPIVAFILMAGMFGVADVLNDSGKNTTATIGAVALGVVFAVLGTLFVLQITGYWDIGLLPIAAVGIAGRNNIKNTIIKHKKLIRQGCAIACVSFAVIGVSMIAIQNAAATYTISPEDATKEAGDTLTVTFTSTEDIFESNATHITILKVDEESPFAVYWTSTKTISDDGLTGHYVIHIPDGATAGTYTITISSGEMSKTITLYIQQDAGLNWMILMTLTISGLFFVGVMILGWKSVKKTKTPLDDEGLIVLGLAGAGELILAAAYYLGYWTI